MCIHCLQSNLWTRTKSNTSVRNLNLTHVIDVLKQEETYALNTHAFAQACRAFREDQGGQTMQVIQKWEEGKISGKEAMDIAPSLKGMAIS